MKCLISPNHQIWKEYVKFLSVIIVFLSIMFLSCMDNNDIPASMDAGGPTEIPASMDAGGPTEIPASMDAGGPTEIPLNSDIPAINDEGFFIEVVEILDINQIEIIKDGVYKKITLIGVDISDTSSNPELKSKAMSFLRFVLEGENVTLEEDTSLNVDAYQNSRYVFVDGIMLNRELLRKGFAKFFNDASIEKYRDVLRSAESEAVDQGLGLWGIGKPGTRKGLTQDQQMGCGTLPCNPNRP